MVSEAYRVMDEQVARCESDLDVALVLGTGFPDFRGGVLKYARQQGEQRVWKRLAEFQRRYGARYSVD
jgi:3-hydroxyacyl-CoA dehydrogenase/enoyl-CoA hydratase/3-hydroxybutyryl-CoA epimerase